MIEFKGQREIYLYSENIDMRLGINKIQILVGVNFKAEEIRNSLFVFCSSSNKIIKIYYEDEYGTWLMQTKLHEGKYKWPKGLQIGERISYQELKGLLKGLEVIESKKRQAEVRYEYY